VKILPMFIVSDILIGIFKVTLYWVERCFNIDCIAKSGPMNCLFYFQIGFQVI
jgi:hypothetical protein